MRLTIVDKQLNVVREVVEGLTNPERFSDFAEFLAPYRGADWRWFVTPIGQMPVHAIHDRHGAIR